MAKCPYCGGYAIKLNDKIVCRRCGYIIGYLLDSGSRFLEKYPLKMYKNYEKIRKYKRDIEYWMNIISNIFELNSEMRKKLSKLSFEIYSVTRRKYKKVSRLAVVIVALYVLSEEYGMINLSLKSILSKLELYNIRISQRRINRILYIVNKFFYKNRNSIRVQQNISNILSQLSKYYPEIDVMEAWKWSKRIWSKITEHGIHHGRKPKTLAAAIIYNALKFAGKTDLSILSFAETFSIPPSSLRRNVKLIQNILQAEKI